MNFIKLTKLENLGLVKEIKTVLFLTNWYPGIHNPFKGVFIREHAIAVSKQGINVFLVNIDIGYAKSFLEILSEEQSKSENLKILTIQMKSVLHKLIYQVPIFQYLIVKKELNKRLNSLQFDLIHSHIIFPAGIIGHWLAKKYKKPHIISEHWSHTAEFIKRHPFKFFGKKAYNSAFRVLPVSNFLERKIESSIKIRHFTIIPNVVDEDLFYYKPKPSRNGIIFLAIANWNKTRPQLKRPDLLIQALALVKKETGLDIKLELAGHGDWLEELEIMASELNLPLVTLGYLPKAELVEVLQNSDYFLHASETETFSIVIAEALKTGTPVIASNVGAIPELMESDFGVLTNNTLEEWTEAIQKVLKSTYNNEAIAQRNKNKFTYKEIGSKLIDIYRETINLTM